MTDTRQTSLADWCVWPEPSPDDLIEVTWSTVSAVTERDDCSKLWGGGVAMVWEATKYEWLSHPTRGLGLLSIIDREVIIPGTAMTGFRMNQS